MREWILRLPNSFEFVRFYRWALADMEREAREDYPLLSTINEPHFQNQLDALREMSIDERLPSGPLVSGPVIGWR